MKGRKRGLLGKEIPVYLPFEALHRLDEVRGNYMTRSKLILWCLDQTINSGKKTPLGATVSSHAPSGRDSSSTNISPNAPAKEVVPNQEGLVSVS
jgi:hypothetical protein